MVALSYRKLCDTLIREWIIIIANMNLSGIFHYNAIVAFIKAYNNVNASILTGMLIS